MVNRVIKMLSFGKLIVIFSVVAKLTVGACAETSFKDAFNAFDADFAAHVIANVAKQTYKETKYNQQDFDYGSSVIESTVTLKGDDKDRIWKKTPFRGIVAEREDTWGSAYACNGTLIFGFHGSFWIADWFQNLDFKLIPAGFMGGSVHKGFLDIINSTFDNMLAVSNAFSAEGIEGKEIIFTGHSLGGALAILAASKFCTQYATTLKPNQVKIITFSAPRVGDKEFMEKMYELIPESPPNILNFVCNRDSVPYLPFRAWMRYENLGLWIDVLSMEQRFNKIQKGIQYWNAGGIDRRFHVFMRFWEHPLVDACVNVAVASASELFFGKESRVVTPQSGIVMFSLFSLKKSLSLFRESAQFFHEIPTKETIRMAWASAQMSVLHSQLDDDAPLSKMALYHERYPFLKMIYRFFT